MFEAVEAAEEDVDVLMVVVGVEEAVVVTVVVVDELVAVPPDSRSSGRIPIGTVPLMEKVVPLRSW